MKKMTALAALLIFILSAAALAGTADLIPPFHWTYHSLSHLHEAGLINEEVVPGKSAFTPTQVASMIVMALKHAENEPEKLGDAEFSVMKQLAAAYKDSFRQAGYDYDEIRKDIEIAAMRAGLTAADDAAKADALSAEAARVVNSFTFDLYKRTASSRSGSSFFISPYSVSTALAMTYAGARGATEKEMEKVLFFSPDVHKSMGALINAINGVPQDVAQVSCANALWPAKEEKILPEFAQTLEEYYGASLSPLDYAGAPENSRRTVNKWVEKNTNNKIKDLVPQGAFTRDTVLTLTNAVYFKSSWLDEFQPENTEPRPFWPTEDHSVNVVTMRRRGGKANYAKFPECEIVEMPYKGDLFSMLVILPDRKKGLDAVEKILTEQQLSEWTSRFIPRRVDISMPKFKQESSYELSDMLSDMGMRSAFSSRADFSGINGTGEIQIDKVLHKTFVDVAEEGTEAAAATAIIMMKSSLAAPQEDVVIFRADHPFIYLIKDNKSNAILFIGRYMKP
ncbi:MAG: serpin family protein [Synergistes sp.]|nr:serpin family protein [Synergistes sp.]